MNLHWQGGITSTELSMDYSVAVKTFGFWLSWSLFGVSDQPWAENCRLKSIGFRLMDPRWCNLINEYPRGGKQFH